MLATLKLLPVTVEISGKLLRQFKAAAKKAFPNETLAYLLGQDAGTSVSIDEFWFPEDVAKYATPGAVMIADHWEAQVKEYAREREHTVLGDIHSHPYNYLPGRRFLPTDCAPSEGDYADPWKGLCGICRVTQSKNGALRSSIRFWGPAVPVEMRIK